MQSAETRAKRAAANRGKKRSPEIRAKFCRIQQERAARLMAQRGYVTSLEQREKISKTLTGRKRTDEQLKNLRAARRADPMRYRQSDEHYKKLSELYSGKPFSGKSFDHTGRTQSLEERLLRRLTHKRGPEHHNWRGNRRPRRNNDNMYSLWRCLVFERDNHTCVRCGQCGGYLTAHHVKPWAKFPELRYDVNNGQTLCPKCHAEVDDMFKRLAYVALSKKER